MSILRGVPWVESVDAKLERAREQLEDIDSACEMFRQRVKRHRVPKVDPQSPLGR